MGKADRTGRWRLGKRALQFGAVAAGLVVADVGLAVGGILRAAATFPQPVDDGPDAALTDPRHLMRSGVVSTPDGTLLHVETSLNLEDHPGDEVLVFVHGWTCNTRFWNAQLNHFGTSRPMIAYDLRGHGLSEMGEKKLGIHTLGQDLEAVLAATLPPGKRAVLVGHSMGGMTIMSWAEQFGADMGERVAAIVLASTAVRGVVEHQKLTPASLPAITRLVNPLVGRAFLSTPVPLPSTSLTSRFTHYLALGPTARAAHVDFSDEMISRTSPISRGAWGAAMYGLNAVAGLEAISVPTAVVVGTEDLLTPPLHADFIAEALDRNGVLLGYDTYPEAGHMVPIERSTEFNHLLDDLLAAL